MKLNVTKEWCMKMAELEAEHGGDIIAGVPTEEDDAYMFFNYMWALIDKIEEIKSKADPYVKEKDSLIEEAQKWFDKGYGYIWMDMVSERSK